MPLLSAPDTTTFHNTLIISALDTTKFRHMPIISAPDTTKFRHIPIISAPDTTTFRHMLIISALDTTKFRYRPIITAPERTRFRYMLIISAPDDLPQEEKLLTFIRGLPDSNPGRYQITRFIQSFQVKTSITSSNGQRPLLSTSLTTDQFSYQIRRHSQSTGQVANAVK